ncbi:MAG: alpha/beta hydrolase [Pseudomonadota bacterium]
MPHRFSRQNRDAVILLHGLARTKASMSRIQTHLQQHGFMVVNQGYPSRNNPIEMLSGNTIPLALEQCKKHCAQKIHFVTHSLGGILVRHYLAHNVLTNLGRVVMLSPPNSGSEVVDKLKNLFFFKWLNGPAGRQLGTDADSIPNQLGLPDYELGIIAGDQTVNPILSWLIPGKNDGKVSVERARLEGMKDFLIVHKSHPFIMNDPFVLEQIQNFIVDGKFSHNHHPNSRQPYPKQKKY